MPKVYDIRLNPGHEYGIDPAERRRERFQNYGLLFSQLAIDAWEAARDATMSEIMATLPPRMQRQIERIRPKLPTLRTDACCGRCGGDGFRNDREEWVVIKCAKPCFRCRGTGLEPKMDPVFFRRRAVDSIRATKDPVKVRAWAEKVVSNLTNPYRCVLLDIAQAVLSGQDPTKLPH